MVTRIPGCTWRPIRHNFTNARRPRTLGAIVHVTAAPRARSQFGWFNNPAARASSTVHVDDRGHSEQYVDADKIAWCQRAGNLEYVSIETQGDANGLWTVAQAAEILRILAWLARHYGFPLVDMRDSKPGRRGVGMHRYGCDPFRVPGGAVWGPRGKVCPGPNRVGQLRTLISRGAPAPTTPKEDDMPEPRDLWGYKNTAVNGDLDAYQMLTNIHANMRVHRGGQTLSLAQEVADAKTLALKAQGENAGLRAAVEALAKGQALTVDQIADAARRGAEDALKDGVKVTIDIPQEG